MTLNILQASMSGAIIDAGRSYVLVVKREGIGWIRIFYLLCRYSSYSSMLRNVFAFVDLARNC